MSIQKYTVKEAINKVLNTNEDALKVDIDNVTLTTEGSDVAIDVALDKANDSVTFFSNTNKAGTSNQRNFSPEYNIVSGTLQDGGTTIRDESSDDSTFGTYGLFYPEIGTLILNANRIESQITKIGTKTSLIGSGSNSDGGNNDAFYETIKGGAFFQAKREETISSRHFFVRATANRFNATTNESYYTESIAGVKRIIPGLQNDPKTFITTVGLYNDADELLAVAKLSKPIIKSRSREALIKVKLDF